MQRTSATPALATRWQVDMDGHHIVALHWSPDGSYWVSDSFLAAALVSVAVSP